VTVLLPAWLQTGSYTAEIDRFVGTALLNPGASLTGRGGVRVVAGTEFQVTASVPPAMTVSVGAGMAFVQGASSATQGVYTVVNDSSFTLAVSAANPSNPRIDLVVLEVLDQAYSGSSNLAQVRVLAGTPATNPAPPTATGWSSRSLRSRSRPTPARSRARTSPTCAPSRRRWARPSRSAAWSSGTPFRTSGTASASS
jgi:hypothetical protein